MKAIDIRTNLHKLIDSIDDETQLTKAYQIIENISTVNEDGVLWAKLTSEEQEELLNIEKDSHNPGNLIDHEEMKKKHKKWL